MIGVFDSGIGGLTVLKALREKLPEYSFIYFGDTARTPYGSKSPETILEYGREDARALISRGAKIIVIACNTVSAVAGERLCEEFAVPVFEVIAPAVREALRLSRAPKIGVIGTRATIGSGAYQKLIQEARPGAGVEALACPLFVPLVEEGWEGSAEAGSVVKKTLSAIQFEGIDTLILGCTHYPLLKEQIRASVPAGVQLIDSAEAVAIEVAQYLRVNTEAERQMIKGGEVRVWVSDKTEHLGELARAWLGKVSIEKI